MGTAPFLSAPALASLAYAANGGSVGRYINLTLFKSLLAPGLALGLLAAGSLAAFVARDQTAQAGLAQTLNVVGLLEQRSPGGRNGAELTKHERQRAAGLSGPNAPFEHARAPEFPREAVSEVTEGLGVPSPEQLLALAEPGKVKDFVG